MNLEFSDMIKSLTKEDKAPFVVLDVRTQQEID